MRTIGSRELKASLGQVLREVRENDEVVVITHRGRPIALIIPETSLATSRRFESVWSEMDALAAEIAREWPESLSASDAVAEDRREIGDR